MFTLQKNVNQSLSEVRHFFPMSRAINTITFCKSNTEKYDEVVHAAPMVILTHSTVLILEFYNPKTGMAGKNLYSLLSYGLVMKCCHVVPRFICLINMGSDFYMIKCIKQ